MIYRLEGIKYIQAEKANGEFIYSIELHKLDLVWHLDDPHFYLYRLSDGIVEKVNRINKLFDSNVAIEMPEIRVMNAKTMPITDGRHRFLKLKELGKKRILVSVSTDSDFQFMDIIGGIAIDGIETNLKLKSHQNN